VPRSALDRYLATKDPTLIRTTTAVDGMPQRFIENAEIRRLESMGLPARLAMSMKYARQWGKESGLGPIAMAKLGLKVLSSGENSFAQTVMAPNLPTLVQRGVVEGNTETGLLPSGQAAAMIDKLESCEELIARMVSEAEARLKAVSALVAAN
jgi:nitronate monooxygenase